MSKMIKGIRVLDKEDLVNIIKLGVVGNRVANIYCFDNDMRYLIPNIENINNFIRFNDSLNEYQIIQGGIFIVIDDLKKFMDMSKIDKIAFYAKTIGDINLEGFGIFTGSRETEDGEIEEDVILFNKFIDVKYNPFWCAYEKFHWNDVTFDDVRTFLIYGTIHGVEKTNEEFFKGIDWKI